MDSSNFTFNKAKEPRPIDPKAKPAPAGKDFDPKENEKLFKEKEAKVYKDAPAAATTNLGLRRGDTSHDGSVSDTKVVPGPKVRDYTQTVTANVYDPRADPQVEGYDARNDPNRPDLHRHSPR